MKKMEREKQIKELERELSHTKSIAEKVPN